MNIFFQKKKGVYQWNNRRKTHLINFNRGSIFRCDYRQTIHSSLLMDINKLLVIRIQRKIVP